MLNTRAISLSLLLAMTAGANGQVLESTWTGGASGNDGLASNWSVNVVPLNVPPLLFNARIPMASGTVTYDETLGVREVNELTVGEGRTMRVASSTYPSGVGLTVLGRTELFGNLAVVNAGLSALGPTDIHGGG